MVVLEYVYGMRYNTFLSRLKTSKKETKPTDKLIKLISDEILLSYGT